VAAFELTAGLPELPAAEPVEEVGFEPEAEDEDEDEDEEPQAASRAVQVPSSASKPRVLVARRSARRRIGRGIQGTMRHLRSKSCADVRAALWMVYT